MNTPPPRASRLDGLTEKLGELAKRALVFGFIWFLSQFLFAFLLGLLFTHPASPAGLYFDPEKGLYVSPGTLAWTPSQPVHWGSYFLATIVALYVSDFQRERENPPS